MSDIVHNMKILKNSNINNINFYAIYDGHGGKEVSTYLEKNLYQYFFLPKGAIFY